MRLLSIVLTAAICGVAVGAAIAYVETRPSAGSPVPTAARATDSAATDTGPRVEVVGGTTYNFGSMQRGTTKSHEFTFRNVGQAPLTLRVLSTTCKCTVGDVSHAPVPPGESVGVRLEWSAVTNMGEYRQSAAIETNDPRQSRVNLSVEGSVTEASGIYPPELIFDKVTAGETRSADVYVMALLQDTLEVGEPTLSIEENRKFFDVSVEPVEPASLPNPKAKRGVRIRVTVKPGLPLGRFDQWLTVTTNLEDAEKLKIPVIGRVVGNISVHGRPYWNEEQGVVRIGHVKSATGIRAPLNIVIRGEGADNAELSIASSDPPELKATLGEPKRLKDTLVHVPLVIEIPPGTPPMARLDTQQNDEARIVLKTNQPDVPEMIIPVRFAVER